LRRNGEKAKQKAKGIQINATRRTDEKEEQKQKKTAERTTVRRCN
jgi:hypothetical protein